MGMSVMDLLKAQEIKAMRYFDTEGIENENLALSAKSWTELTLCKAI
jgi:hypothetical protein